MQFNYSSISNRILHRARALPVTVWHPQYNAMGRTKTDLSTLTFMTLAMCSFAAENVSSTYGAAHGKLANTNSSFSDREYGLGA